MVNQQETNVPPGWRYCMVARSEGPQDCYPPAGPGERPRFSDKLNLYDRDVERSCEPCVCVPSRTPRECVARVSAYSDRACSEDALLGTTTVTAGGAYHCLRPEEEGAALGSIRAEWDVNELGLCEPAGGEPYPRPPSAASRSPPGEGEGAIALAGRRRAEATGLRGTNSATPAAHFVVEWRRSGPARPCLRGRVGGAAPSPPHGGRAVAPADLLCTDLLGQLPAGLGHSRLAVTEQPWQIVALVLATVGVAETAKETRARERHLNALASSHHEHG